MQTWNFEQLKKERLVLILLNYYYYIMTFNTIFILKVPFALIQLGGDFTSQHEA